MDKIDDPNKRIDNLCKQNELLNFDLKDAQLSLAKYQET